MRWFVSALIGISVLIAGCQPYVRAPVRRIDDRRAATVRPEPVRELPPVNAIPRAEVREIPPVAGRASGVAILGGSTALDPYIVYDKSSEITVHGAINGLTRVPLAGDRTGLFVRINAGGSFPYIYLGPEKWLFLNDIDPRITNTILATGSRNGQMILARRIVLNGYEFDVRDVNGNPYWEEPVAATARNPLTGEPIVR